MNEDEIKQLKNSINQCEYFIDLAKQTLNKYEESNNKVKDSWSFHYNNKFLLGAVKRQIKTVRYVLNIANKSFQGY